MTDTEASEHYHIDASSEGPECADDVFYALDSALFWLDGECDALDQQADAMGDAEDYEGAWKSHKAAEKLHNTILNVRNVVDQHFGHKDRAPLYTDDDEGNALLLATALRMVDEINSSDTNISVYQHAYVAGQCDEEADEE